ncbi:hypothetical protein A0H81_12412, partial [Grifola frondosa]
MREPPQKPPTCVEGSRASLYMRKTVVPPVRTLHGLFNGAMRSSKVRSCRCQRRAGGFAYRWCPGRSWRYRTVKYRRIDCATDRQCQTHGQRL